MEFSKFMCNEKQVGIKREFQFFIIGRVCNGSGF